MASPCSEPDCPRPRRRYGLCDAHSQRLKAGKSINGSIRQKIDNMEVAFATYGAARGPGCWEWTGPSRAGYGQLSSNYQHIGAHRYAYELWVGPIPDGMGVLHYCDNPPCFRPDHLHTGPQSVNMTEAAERLRTRRGEHCSWAVLTEQGVREIRLRAASGDETQKTIAAAYGISRQHVSDIVRRVKWGWLPD